MNKKITILTLMLLAAVSVLGVLYFVQQTPDQPANVAQTEEIDASDWKTYRNEEFEFEFKYPGEWAIFDVSDSNFVGLYVDGVAHYLEDNLNWGELVVFFNVSDAVVNMFEEGNIGQFDSYVNYNGISTYRINRYQTGQDIGPPSRESRIYFFRDKKDDISYISCHTFGLSYKKNKVENIEIISSELCDSIADTVNLN